MSEKKREIYGTQVNEKGVEKNIERNGKIILLRVSRDCRLYNCGVFTRASVYPLRSRNAPSCKRLFEIRIGFYLGKIACLLSAETVRRLVSAAY